MAKKMTKKFAKTPIKYNLVQIGVLLNERISNTKLTTHFMTWMSWAVTVKIEIYVDVSERATIQEDWWAANTFSQIG